jgi:hypothetical protein
MHVTKKTHPDLGWKQPARFAVAEEIIYSDAYRCLSKIQADVLLYALFERQYPGKNGKTRRVFDYWSPLNGYKLALPHDSIIKFFSKRGKMKPPNKSTVGRAIKQIMHNGFLSLVKQGGHGTGDMNIYRLEHNWRTWRKGDGPCFVADGMSRGKGFCQPGCGEFCPTKN